MCAYKPRNRGQGLRGSSLFAHMSASFVPIYHERVESPHRTHCAYSLTSLSLDPFPTFSPQGLPRANGAVDSWSRPDGHAHKYEGRQAGRLAGRRVSWTERRQPVNHQESGMFPPLPRCVLEAMIDRLLYDYSRVFTRRPPRPAFLPARGTYRDNKSLLPRVLVSIIT